MFCCCGALVSHPQLASEDIRCPRCSAVQKESHSAISVSKTFDRKEERVLCRAKGARIKEKCPKCGNDELIYNTAQLRSADEGQTVFYTCDRCDYKETVHS